MQSGLGHRRSAPIRRRHEGSGALVRAAVDLVQPVVQLWRRGQPDRNDDAAEKHAGDERSKWARILVRETEPHGGSLFRGRGRRNLNQRPAANHATFQ